MKYLFTILCLFILSGCYTTLSESELDAYLNAQIGRYLPEKQIKNCEKIELRDGVYEYIPNRMPRSGSAVVWAVDSKEIDEVSAASSEPLVGVIVSWRLIGDKKKVRIPITYTAG